MEVKYKNTIQKKRKAVNKEIKEEDSIEGKGGVQYRKKNRIKRKGKNESKRVR